MKNFWPGSGWRFVVDYWVLLKEFNTLFATQNTFAEEEGME